MATAFEVQLRALPGLGPITLAMAGCGAFTCLRYILMFVRYTLVQKTGNPIDKTGLMGSVSRSNPKYVYMKDGESRRKQI